MVVLLKIHRKCTLSSVIFVRYKSHLPTEYRNVERKQTPRATERAFLTIKLCKQLIPPTTGFCMVSAPGFRNRWPYYSSGRNRVWIAPRSPPLHQNFIPQMKIERSQRLTSGFYRNQQSLGIYVLHFDASQCRRVDYLFKILLFRLIKHL